MNTELVNQNNFRKILIDFLKDPDNPVLDFKSLKKKGLLQSNLVSLETIDLWGCKFDYSFFKDLKYANIQWGLDFGISSKENGILRLKVLTEVYRQLKLNASNNQNGFDKLKLQRLENLNYWERVNQDKSERRTDRFLLRIDRTFSNFGQDYLRPIGWLFGIQLVLCSIIWWREDVFHNYNASDYYQAAENGLSQYLTMLIPVFKTPEYWTGMSVSISIIIRLFNALMIYYFIRAVHKFGKNQ